MDCEKLELEDKSIEIQKIDLDKELLENQDQSFNSDNLKGIQLQNKTN